MLSRPFFVLNSLCAFGEELPIDAFHAEMFHGSYSRAGVPDYYCENYRPDSSLEHPLYLTKNTYRIGDLFEPTGSIIVSERMKDRLSVLPNIAFLRVRFEKLFEFPYAEGDFSIYDDPDFRRAEDLIASLPHRPELEQQLQPYYELLVYRHQDVQLIFDDLTVVKMQIPESVYFDEPMVAGLSVAMLEQFPILWHDHGVILAEKAYMILKDSIRPPYFSVDTGTLD